MSGPDLPVRRRLAAYALVVRGGDVLLTRLSARVTDDELWTLPGGGVEHGEDPRAAVVREVHEETGLEVSVGDQARVRSWHAPGFVRDGLSVDLHHVRLVYDGTVDADAPAPHVVEVDGTTAAAAWLPLADVVAGRVPLATLARQELADYAVARVQRVSAKALVRRGDDVLLARISPRGAHPGTWTLPGGGIEHGEPPAAAVAREVREECGLSCEVGAVLAVTDAHFSGTAPSGRDEDFHAVQVVYAVTVAPDAEPGVVELGGTTDAVAWVPVADVLSGSLPVEPVVLTALTT